MIRFHFYAAIVWALLVIPTVLWWNRSVLWVALVGVYAASTGHWSAYQSAKAEEQREV